MSKSCLCHACAVPLPCLCRAFCRSCRAVVVPFVLTCYAFAVPATLSLTLSIYFDVSESYDGILFIESSQMLQFMQVSCSASTVASHMSEVAGCGSSASNDSRLHHSVVLEAQGHELRFLTFPSHQFLIFLLLTASSVAAGSHS